VSGVHPVAEAGFGSAADVYERARPSYPADAVRWIAQRARLGRGKTVVDVGAGTGKLTRLLLSTHALLEHRVLKPGGALVLVWNSRDMSDPLQRALEDVLAPLRETAPYQLGGAWRRPLEASGLFGPPEEAQFRIEQRLTVAGFCDRVTSTSFVAAMAPAERDALLDRVRALVSGRPEPFAFPYVTEVYLTPRTG